jgi:arylsulfatase A-like enzyme
VLRRLLDSPRFYYALAGILFLVLLVTQIEVRLPPRPSGTAEDIPELASRDDVNLVFIVIDTLRADRLHAYGHGRETSPNLDYLAQTGIRFARVGAQSSWTKASMASLWTATWPRRTGILRFNHAVPPEAEMPAEVLKRAGFRTAGVWRNGWVAPNFGFHQGFDTYVQPMQPAAPQNFRQEVPPEQRLVGTDEATTNTAIEFMRSYGHQRFFLYLHYMDVHQYAFDEASALFGTSYSDNYDNAIRWVDRNVAAVLNGLAELDLWKRTMVVVVSDHGEGFREHGQDGHARTLYGEVIDVPWIIGLPFALERPVVVEQPVANVDVWPTLYALLGIEPPGVEVDGRSAVPAILAAAEGSAEPAGRPVFAQLDRHWGRPRQDPDPIVSVTLGSHRMIRELKDGTPRIEVYDLAKDPGEERSLPADDLPPALQEAFSSYLAADSPPWGQAPPEVELDEMQLGQLRALGYVIK